MIFALERLATVSRVIIIYYFKLYKNFSGGFVRCPTSVALQVSKLENPWVAPRIASFNIFKGYADECLIADMLILSPFSDRLSGDALVVVDVTLAAGAAPEGRFPRLLQKVGLILLELHR